MKTRKWCKNIVTFVISFAMVIGIFSSMQMEVKAANSYSVDVTDQSAIQKAKARIYNPGDTLTFNNIPLSSDEINMAEIRLNCYSYENPTKLLISALDYLDYNDLNTNTVFICFPSDIQYENIHGNIQYGKFHEYTHTQTQAPTGKENVAIHQFIIDLYVSNTSSAPSESATTPSHECNFQWVTTVEPQPGVDGLEEYKCVTCGVVKESQPIPAGMATVKNLYGFIKDAPENGTVTTDFGTLHTISDYLLKKMAERSDATVTIQFEYKNQKLQITFPAGTDYTPVLNDTDTMYGFYGVAAKLGLTVTER